MTPYLTIHRLFRRLQQKNRFIVKIPYTGLTPAETHFILELQADPKRSASEIGTILEVDLSYSSRICQSLAKKGLLKISVSDSDARKKRLSITKKGDALIAKIDSVADELFEHLSKPLTATETVDLIKFFRKIADGYGKLPGIKRRGEHPYRVEQRRLTRCFGMLNDNVFQTSISSSVWQILAEIVLSPCPMTPSDLVELLAIPQNSLSSILTNLEQQRLIKRAVDPSDKRGFTLHALKAGKSLLQKIENKAVSDLTTALGETTEKDLEYYASIFQKFIGETDTSLTLIPENYSVEEITTAEQHYVARDFAVRKLVEMEATAKLPDQIIGISNKNWVLNYKGKPVAVLEIERKSDPKSSRPIIKLAAWEPRISKTLLYSFAVRSWRMSSGQEQLISSFEPLQSLLRAYNSEFLG